MFKANQFSVPYAMLRFSGTQLVLFCFQPMSFASEAVKWYRVHVSCLGSMFNVPGMLYGIMLFKTCLNAFVYSRS